MEKIYNYKGGQYIRKESKRTCFGCCFLDEETGDCLAPMPGEIGADCMEIIDTKSLMYKDYQWIKV